MYIKLNIHKTIIIIYSIITSNNFFSYTEIIKNIIIIDSNILIILKVILNIYLVCINIAIPLNISAIYGNIHPINSVNVIMVENIGGVLLSSNNTSSSIPVSISNIPNIFLIMIITYFSLGRSSNSFTIPTFLLSHIFNISLKVVSK